MVITRQKTGLAVKRPPDEPRRLLQLGKDDALTVERNERLDMSKLQLIERLEAIETARDQALGHCASYERIQRSDRKQIKELERQNAALIGNVKLAAGLMLSHTIDSLWEQVQMVSYQDQVERAMQAVRIIEGTLVFFCRETAIDEQVILNRVRSWACMKFKDLCDWACYRPRPDTIGDQLIYMAGIKGGDEIIEDIFGTAPLEVQDDQYGGQDDWADRDNIEKEKARAYYEAKKRVKRELSFNTQTVSYVDPDEMDDI